MEKQFKIYSFDTKAFYTEEERTLNTKKFETKKKMEVYENWAEYQILHNSDIEINKYIEKTDRLLELKSKKDLELSEQVELGEIKQLFRKPKKTKTINKEYKTSQELVKEEEIKSNKLNKTIKNHLSDNEHYKLIKKELNELNKELSSKLEETNSRELNPKTLTDYNQITLFENALSRAMNISPDEIVIDMMIVRAYHYSVLKQLIENGFTYTDINGQVKKFKVFTASAGQIRTKKVLFIEENRWDKYEKTLMCGLTIDNINNSYEKGCNINKFLAYLALCNSATDEIQGFDIDRAIVIEDFETMVNGEVDYIDNKTFEVTRKTMDIPVPHSDGCGWVLPSVNKKNFMARLPWVKGLMTPVDYIKFCDEYKKETPEDKRYKIKDIYNKEWDLKGDNIHYVFSKSQFKMYKYYKSWSEYKEYFKKYNCKANMCNLEPDTKEFRKACFNYQMWQTLIDINDEEIAEFTDKVDEFITKGYSDRKTMLQILGADATNKNKTYLQKCIEIYPELIRDYHVKEELASTLNARKKEAKYGKFKIDSTYSFLLPDVVSWMEYVLLGNTNPEGVLKDNEVSCRLYKGIDELLVNRSPHLYREHAVRNNIINDKISKWFKTDGIYTSCHDLISKILQFDVDGDKALVVAEKTLISVAKRNMEGIVPLYYEMGKAEPQNIDNTNIYESLTKAFKFNNIGKFSNKLTVLWNNDNPNLTTIAQVTALNNFTIDGAKTLLMPTVPRDVERDMKEANGKLPYFFQFAKDKDKSEVSQINNSTVNRICTNIEGIKQGDYDFSSIGRFNRSVLMNNSNIEINEDIVNTYKELEKNKRELFTKAKSNNIAKEEILSSVNSQIKISFIAECNKNNIDIRDGIDMVVRYIYSKNRNSKKSFLFDIFGDIIYSNLKNNINKLLDDGYIMCECCGRRVRKETNNQVYCKDCAKDKIREKDRIRKRNSTF